MRDVDILKSVHMKKYERTGGELDGVDFFGVRHCNWKRTVRKENSCDTLLFTFVIGFVLRNLRHPFSVSNLI